MSAPIPPDDGALRPDRPRLEVVSAGDARDVVERLPALTPAFTPLADLETCGTLGHEVGLGAPGDLAVSPRDWSQRARAGSERQLEAQVLRSALDQRRAIPDDAAMLISLSGPGFASAPVQVELAARGTLAGVWLAVQSEPDTELRALRGAIAAARALGATIVLDEGEMGYPALRRLVRLRPDAIRLAPDFVEELDRDAARSAVVETLVALARRIGARVIAEGVSSPAEVTALVELGVSVGSGPLFGEHLPRAGPLPVGAAGAIAASVAVADARGGTISSLVEPLPMLPLDATLGQLADAFLDDARSDFVVLVDSESRPARLAERAAMLRAEPYEHAALAVSGRTELRTVARRAAARDAYERFVPVVCTDARGRVVGVVRVDRLLEALAAGG